jgi:hypothetical protein
LFSSKFEEASQTFTYEIRQEAVEEADLLCACMSLCNSWILASKKLQVICDGSVCIVCLGNTEDEVEVFAVVEVDNWGRMGNSCISSSIANVSIYPNNDVILPVIFNAECIAS